MKRIANITVTLQTSFCSYENQAKDKKVLKQIAKYVKETLQNEASFIPLYIEKDEHGSAIEDSSKKSSIEIKQAKLT